MLHAVKVPGRYGPAVTLEFVEDPATYPHGLRYAGARDDTDELIQVDHTLILNALGKIMSKRRYSVAKIARRALGKKVRGEPLSEFERNALRRYTFKTYGHSYKVKTRLDAVVVLASLRYSESGEAYGDLNAGRVNGRAEAVRHAVRRYLLKSHSRVGIDRLRKAFGPGGVASTERIYNHNLGRRRRYSARG